MEVGDHQAAVAAAVAVEEVAMVAAMVVVMVAASMVGAAAARAVALEAVLMLQHADREPQATTPSLSRLMASLHRNKQASQTSSRCCRNTPRCCSRCASSRLALKPRLKVVSGRLCPPYEWSCASSLAHPLRRYAAIWIQVEAPRSRHRPVHAIATRHA